MNEINERYECTCCANYIDCKCDYPQCINYELVSTTDCFKAKELKKIDLSCLIDSDIDIEFVDDNFENETIKIGTLSHINNTGTEFKYVTRDCISYKKCRIRQDHWMAWDGGMCPLPNGLNVVVRLRNDETTRTDNTGRYNWEYGLINSSYDVIAFKVLGTSVGWG